MGAVLIAILSVIVGLILGRGCFLLIDPIIRKFSTDIYVARKKVVKVSLWIVGLFFVATFFAFNSNCDLSVPFILFGIAILAFGTTFWFGKEKEYLEKEIASHCFHFNGDDLIIEKRHPLLESRLKIGEYVEMNLAYNPQKTHITGASIGGVFTGEIYTTGGNYYFKPGKGTGSYYLYYAIDYENDSYHTVKKIRLQGEALQDAKRCSLFADLKCDPQGLEASGSREYCGWLKTWLAGE